jgi:hypothetical protein
VNEAYNVEYQQSLNASTLFSPNTLQVITIANGAHSIADGQNRYTTQCNDIIEYASLLKYVPFSGFSASDDPLPWNIADNSNQPCIDPAIVIEATILFQILEQYEDIAGIPSLVNFLIEIEHAFDVHSLRYSYLLDGSATQAQIFGQMANSISTNTTYHFDSTTSDGVWLSSSYGGSENDTLQIGGWGDQYYSMFKFNTSSLPTTATKATLRFYKYSEPGNFSQIYLDRVTSPWTVATRWSNQPTSVNITTLPQPAGYNTWYEIDITGLYNGWQNGSYPNYGIMLRPTTWGNNVHNAFYSAEYTDTTLRPQLVLVGSSVSSAQSQNTPPIITLSGANPFSLVAGDSYVEPGYTATDTQDGDISSQVVVSGSVNTSVVGTYTLTYNVTDSSGLPANPVTRTVNVTAPSGNTTTYTLSSSQCNVVWITNYYYNYGQHDADMIDGGWGDSYYSLLGCSLNGMPLSATAVKLRLYEYPSSHGGGRSQIYFDQVTSSWNNATVWQTQPSSVNLSLLPTPVDNHWYEIDITSLYNGWQNGSYPNYGIMLRPASNNNIFNVFRSTEYSDANYRPQIVVTTSTGTDTPPVIALSGTNPMSLTAGTSFVDPGYTATDNRDGNITNLVVVSGSVNTSAVGTYTLTYSVTDSNGLSATPIIRTVVVTAPIAQLTGLCVTGNPTTIQVGDTAYFAAGWQGGTGTIHFSWIGIVAGDISYTTQTYSVTGLYNTSVLISDSGSPQQQFMATCPQLTVTPPPLTASCYILPTSVKINTAAAYDVNVSGGYPPYTYYLPGTLIYQSGGNAISTVFPGSNGTQTYAGIVKDSQGQVLHPACSVTVTP